MRHSIVPALLLATMLASPADADEASPTKAPHITTTGQASLEVVPDQADIYLAVTAEKPTAQEASVSAADGARKLADGLAKQGLSERDMKVNFSLVTIYDNVTDMHGGWKRVFQGYRGTETVEVHVKDIAKVPQLTSDMISLGANELRSISFSYSKEAEARRKLKADAIRDALAQARIYTDALHLTVNQVIQIGDDTSTRDAGEADLPSIRTTGTQAPRIAPTVILPGTQTLRESVSATFAISGTLMPGTP